MDGRIEAGFRHRFGALLASRTEEDRAREIERAFVEARERARHGDGDLVRALLRVYEEKRARLGRREQAPTDAPQPALTGDRPPRFLCDASLGGLARWLRAAGYEAALAPAVVAKGLPEEALRRGLVLLTTDAEALERRIVRDGSLRVSWLPTALRVAEKLALVCRDLGLSLREPRCMACGGPLEPRLKEEVQPRIPPRTARWKDEYFVCAACDRLFWQGTHWERIAAVLRAASVAA